MPPRIAYRDLPNRVSASFCKNYSPIYDNQNGRFLPLMLSFVYSVDCLVSNCLSSYREIRVWFLVTILSVQCHSSGYKARLCWIFRPREMKSFSSNDVKITQRTFLVTRANFWETFWPAISDSESNEKKTSDRGTRLLLLDDYVARVVSKGSENTMNVISVVYGSLHTKYRTLREETNFSETKIYP